LNSQTSLETGTTAAVASTPTAKDLRRPTAGTVIRVAVMVLLGIMLMYPLLGLLLAPTRTEASMMHGGIAIGTWANVQYAWRQIMGFDSGIFGVWMKNTVVMVVGGAILAIILSVPSGYAMARLQFRGRSWLIFATLLFMVMPNTVLVIPLFLEVATVHMLDSFWPIIVIYGFYPFGVYLAFIHFKTALPMELVEAGRIDGLSEIGIFFRVAVPLARQAVALVGFFGFVAGWTNFFLPYVLLPQTQSSPVAVGLLQMISSSQLVNPELGLNVQLYMPELALAAIVAMIPVMVIFIAAQRYLQRGAMMGAVKG
jgi:multiple sugar transport system permease protein